MSLFGDLPKLRKRHVPAWWLFYLMALVHPHLFPTPEDKRRRQLHKMAAAGQQFCLGGCGKVVPQDSVVCDDCALEPYHGRIRPMRNILTGG